MKQGTHPNSLKALKPAKKGEVRNPKGRPRQTITTVLDDLRAQGIQEVKKVDVQAAFQLLLGAEKGDLRAIWGDDSKPMIIRIVAKQLLSSYDQAHMLERMLDRVHGRATQKIAGDEDMAPVAVRVILPQSAQE